MKIVPALRAATVVFPLVVMACQEVEEPSQTSSALESGVAEADAAGTQFGVYQVDVPEMGAAEIRAYVDRIVPLIAADLAPSQVSLRTPEAKNPQNSDAPLVAAYSPGRLTLFNRTLDADHTSPENVLEAGADSIMRGVARGLATAGVISNAQLDFSAMTLERLTQAEGQAGGPTNQFITVSERIKQYHFFLPLRIGNIVVNDGGLLDHGALIAVDRSGQVAQVDVKGPILGVRADTLKPVSQVQRLLRTADIDRRAAADYPGAEITPLGLRYSLPEGPGRHTLRPRQVYRIVPITQVQGEVIRARALMVYYSIADRFAAPEVWPKPNPNDLGDPR
jgi:hypothetical protein